MSRCLHGADASTCEDCPRPIDWKPPAPPAPPPAPTLIVVPTNSRVAEQVAPAPERPELPAVWDLVLADLPSLPAPGNYRHDSPACYRLLLRLAQLLAVHLGTDLAADMRERDATGRQRYGTPLQPNNGRRALVDAYQEILDGCVYMRQDLYERGEDPLR